MLRQGRRQAMAPLRQRILVRRGEVQQHFRRHRGYRHLLFSTTATATAATADAVSCHDDARII